MELVCHKNYLNLAKIFILYSKWWQIKQNTQQRPDVKFLVADKYKPCEIYRRMYDACYNTKKKKLNYKWTKHGFFTEPEWKRLCLEWIYADSALRKKFLTQWSVKKVMLTVFWDMKKVVIVKRASYYEHLR